jgi:hypothetical protein
MAAMGIFDLRFLIDDLHLEHLFQIINRQSSIVNAFLAGRSVSRYIIRVKGLTKQEQLVLCIVLGLLLTGWAVKTYRTAHPPPATTTQPAKP